MKDYPQALQDQVHQLIVQDSLAEYLQQRYPARHQIQRDKALYAYALALKQHHLRNAPAIRKVIFDNRLALTHR
ncbi:metal-dependent hydrolase, partial [Pseudomonas syringae pv. tagetis]